MQPASRLQAFLANRKLVAACAVAVVLIILMLIPTVQRQTTFTVDRTDPKLSNVATITPYIRVNFTRELSTKDIKYTSSTNFIKSYSIKGKMIQFNIKGGSFDPGKSYSITIQSISSKSGETITDKKFSFKTTERSYDSLSDDQRKAIIAAQDIFEYSPESITFNGVDDLVNYGITDSQLTGLKRALYQYSLETGKKYQDITVVRSTVVEGPVTPESERSSLYFTVTFDNAEAYKAQLDSFDLTSIQLILRDMATNTATTFDSGTIDTFTTN